MRTTQDWLDEYSESHQNPVNKAVHWICVPLIALTVIGVLWSLPVPAVFAEISPLMNWGMFFMMASVVYYFILSPSLAIGMLAVIAAFTGILVWLDGFSTPLWIISVTIFVLAWVGGFTAGLLHVGTKVLRADSEASPLARAALGGLVVGLALTSWIIPPLGLLVSVLLSAWFVGIGLGALIRRTARAEN